MDLEWPSRIVSFSLNSHQDWLSLLAIYFVVRFKRKVHLGFFIFIYLFFFVTVFSTRWINTVDSLLNWLRLFFFFSLIEWIAFVHLLSFFKWVFSPPQFVPHQLFIGFPSLHVCLLIVCASTEKRRRWIHFCNVVRPVRGQLSAGDALMLIYKESLYSATISTRFILRLQDGESKVLSFFLILHIASLSYLGVGAHHRLWEREMIAAALRTC